MIRHGLVGEGGRVCCPSFFKHGSEQEEVNLDQPKQG